MDPDLPAQSPDKLDLKPSFRKPSNDAANRKYRRHSPIGGSDSSSSGGSPKRGRSRSPVYSMDDRNRISDDRRRKDDGRELERESSHYRSSRGSDSHRHADRSMYGNSHDYRRHNDYSRHERHVDEEERNYQRSSRSGRESRGGTRYDHARHDSKSDRSRDNWRDVDKYSRDKSESSGHRSKDKERETIVPEHHRHKDRDPEKAVSGNKHINLSRDDTKSGERERNRDREARDDRRDRRRSPDYKNDHVSSHDSILGRDNAALRSKETHRSSNKEMDGQEDLVRKRKHDEREADKRKEKYTREPEETPNKSSSVSTHHERDGRTERCADKIISLTEDQNSSAKKLKHGPSEGDEKPSSSSKQAAETAEVVTSKPVNSTDQAGAANDLDAAKVAAMKAAELVNKNLVGGGYLSTDQKKKLLWGNKKNTAPEEPQTGNRWDLQLFADRERQEKFNKLMGVKGEAVPEQRPDDKDGSLRAEQRELLNMDLEKQYTAGLRRRDGRTVGLGL